MADLPVILSLIDSEGVLPWGVMKWRVTQSSGIPVVIGGVVLGTRRAKWVKRVTSINGRLMICECLLDNLTTPV